jgi:hypothetical protein
MKRLTLLFLSVLLLVACSPSRPTPDQPIEQVFVASTLSATPMPMPTSNNRTMQTSEGMSMQSSNGMPVTPTPTTDPSILGQLFPNSNAGSELTRIDQQGMIVVEVTPVNLGTPGDTLIFEVALNTHSVDLNFNLAQHATLMTDTGKVVQATVWDGPMGGHHVSGKLTFPVSVEGESILNGATKLTLEIRDVDAELRTFEWTLN